MINSTLDEFAKLDGEPSMISEIRPEKSRSSENTSSFTAKKFSYHFGIDYINFSQISVNENMCFISEDIEMGDLKEDEYIQLTSEFDTGENGSIEFYILDGSEPKPILPIGTETVINEKIFFGLRTRFSIDTDNEVIIKKNGSPIDITLEQAINSNEDGYTVSYTPIDAHNIRVNNYTVRVKAILRTYNKNSEAPHIKNIAIRKYGRSSLWTSDTIN